ncbi:MAG: ABC transporter permease subunit [Deltaproteobacteria bacterium]|nr:ABC transporter permease subunit [Deltaproteobacteria bacterium]
MKQIFAIAKNTFREAIRDRILYGFLFFAVCLILFTVVLGELSFNEEIRATIDIGMAGISLFAVLMAIFLGITLLHKEIEKRTLYTILSRPISRNAYLVGKFLGLALTMIVQIVMMFSVWMVVLHIQGGSLTAGILLSTLLMTCETIVIISMALFFTSFSSPFLSGLFCFGLFVAGRNADFINQLAQQKSMASMAPLLNGVSAALPSFYLFYPSGKMVEGSWATVNGQFISSGYMASAIGYSMAYTAAFLVLSAVLLNRRDFI